MSAELNKLTYFASCHMYGNMLSSIALDGTVRKAGKAGRVARDGDQRQRHPFQVSYYSSTGVVT